MMHEPHMRAGIFRGLDIRSGIYDRCLVMLDLVILELGLGSLYELHRLHGPDLCLCIFLCRPGLELLERGFGWWLRIFGLALRGRVKRGSHFADRRRLTCSRRQSLSARG